MKLWWNKYFAGKIPQNYLVTLFQKNMPILTDLLGEIGKSIVIKADFHILLITDKSISIIIDHLNAKSCKRI